MFNFNFEELVPYQNERLSEAINKIIPPYQKGLITAGEVLASVSEVLHDELDFFMVDESREDKRDFFNIISHVFSEVHEIL